METTSKMLLALADPAWQQLGTRSASLVWAKARAASRTRAQEMLAREVRAILWVTTPDRRACEQINDTGEMREIRYWEEFCCISSVCVAYNLQSQILSSGAIGKGYLKTCSAIASSQCANPNDMLCPSFRTTQTPR